MAAEQAYVITIDGPAGVGKSTAARGLAARLGAVFLDTGAMYRAATLAALEHQVDLADVEAVGALLDRLSWAFQPDQDQLRIWIDGVEKTHELREPAIAEKVGAIASAPALRARLTAMQRAFAAQWKRIVTEGRDQGTVVFPDAQVKFFLTADPIERARRRWREWQDAGKKITLQEVLESQQKRDTADQSRAVAPLKPADDAIVVDTTHLTSQQVIELLEQKVKSVLGCQ